MTTTADPESAHPIGCFDATSVNQELPGSPTALAPTSSPPQEIEDGFQTLLGRFLMRNVPAVGNDDQA